jgi:hypothetical protein
MKKQHLDDAEVVSRIQLAEQNSYGANDSELASDRATALDYYLGKPFGNEIDGRSQVVSTDVADVIESLMPQLMKIFASGDEVVKFVPRGPEDIDGAEQETEALNYLIMERNGGYNLFYTLFKDSLLGKNAYAKVYWEDSDEVETEYYKGLTDDELAMLGQDGEVEIVEHTEYPDEIDAQQRAEALQQMMIRLQQANDAAQQGNQQAQADVPQIQQSIAQLQGKPPAMLHDVKVEISKERGEICIEPVAPENMMIAMTTKSVSLQHADFVQHREMLDKAEIEDLGFTLPDSAAPGNEEESYSEESDARDLYSESQSDDIIDRYLVRDSYIRVNGKLMRYVLIGDDIVHKEEAEVIPFVSICPIPMPHRHIGRSIADLVMDIQLIKSTLMRGQLDNIYLANSPRFGVSERVNLDDMLVSRPGGVVRVQGEPMGAIMPLQSPPLPPQSFQLIEYIDGVREQRTGATRYNQGIDANSLNKTATGIQQIMSAAQERVLLIARNYAEQLKELFILTHRLMKMYSQRPMVMRLRNEWVNVDPRTWKTRYDMSISVGLGTGNKDQQLMHIQNILMAQKEAMALGLTDPKRIYNALAKLTINAGFRNPEEFWIEPKDGQPMPPPPANPLIEIEQMKLKADQQKFQAQAQLDQQKAQADLQQEQLRSANDVEIERQKIMAQMELEQYKAQLEAQTTLEKARIDAEAKMAMEQIKAANQAPPASVNVNNDPNGDFSNTLATMMEQQQQNMQQIAELLSRPKQIIRGPDGRALGVQ